jgi:hypothetical protein
VTDVELVPRPSTRKLLRRWLEHRRSGQRSNGTKAHEA